MTVETQTAGAPKAAQQLKEALALRKALFGDKLLVTTAEAAPTIGRAPSTLRKWAMSGRGPIQPVRADGGLLWKVSDLMKMAGEVL
jgi:hypothetical protein